MGTAAEWTLLEESAWYLGWGWGGLPKELGAEATPPYYASPWPLQPLLKAESPWGRPGWLVLPTSMTALGTGQTDAGGTGCSVESVAPAQMGPWGQLNPRPPRPECMGNVQEAATGLARVPGDLVGSLSSPQGP